MGKQRKLHGQQSMFYSIAWIMSASYINTTTFPTGDLCPPCWIKTSGETFDVPSRLVQSVWSDCHSERFEDPYPQCSATCACYIKMLLHFELLLTVEFLDFDLTFPALFGITQ